MTEISTNPIKTFSGGAFSKWLAMLLLVFAGALGAQAQAPVASFTSDVVNGCSPLLVKFNNTSTGAPFTRRQWRIVDQTGVQIALYQNNDTPSALFVNSGTYSVALTVANASGTDVDSQVAYITVLPTPIISFTASDTTGCAPKNITFTANITNAGPAPGYTWDFGDNTTFGTTNPINHTYIDSGSFSVTLIVGNSARCTSAFTKPDYIKLVRTPQANFNYGVAGACKAPINVSLTNISTNVSGPPPVTYLWDFGDLTSLTTPGFAPSAIVHPYATAGNYIITLTASNGICSTTKVQPISAITFGSTAAFTVANACVGQPINITESSTPLPDFWFWDFGDTTTDNVQMPFKVYSSPGTRSIRLIVKRGNCYDTTFRNIVINDYPAADFTANTTAGCTPPLTVTFTNTTIPSGLPFTIDYGDATPPGTSLTHTYTALGTYNATLTATNASNCSSTSAPITITIGAAAMNVTIAGNSCKDSVLTFKAILAIPVPGATYRWNFGAGLTAPRTSDTITHTFTTPGSYTITAIATLPSGCTATFTDTIKVGTPIGSDFTVTPRPACLDSPTLFSANTPGPAGTSYTWAVQGIAPFISRNVSGDTSYRFSPSTNPSTSNLFVRLTTNNNGCTTTTFKPNYLGISGPKAGFTFSTPNCANKLTQAFDGATLSLRETSYSWDFGDGSVGSTSPTPTHTYATYGRYKVTLTVSDGTCVGRISKFIPIYDVNDSFSANKTTICPGNNILFTLNSRTGIDKVRWQFNTSDPADTSGTVASSPINHIYDNVNAAGFSVKLVTIDSLGCRDSFTRTNYIKVRGIIANFGATTSTAPCSPGSVTFLDSSVVNGSPIIVHNWTFGDGGILTGNNPNPTHLYGAGSSGSSYTVKLVVADTFGCRDSLIRPAYITPLNPTPSFTVQGGTLRCKNESIRFVNTSQNTVRYEWIWGDGTPIDTSSTDTVTHAYATAGIYPVRLVGITAGGCRDTSNPTSINIVPNIADFTLSGDTLKSCPPAIVNFTARTGLPAGTKFYWDFGNGNVSNPPNSTRTAVATYSVGGTYPIKLIVETPTGCRDSVTKTVRVLGPSATFTYATASGPATGPIGGCAPFTVTFTANNVTNSNSTTYFFGDGNVYSPVPSSGTSSFSYTYTTDSTYNPKLLIGDSTCYVLVNAPGSISVGSITANFTTPNNDTNVCAGTPVQFTDASVSTAGPAVSWNWDFGDGTTDNVQNPVKTFINTSTVGIQRNVRLIIGTSNCFDTITRIIFVRPSPNITSITGGGTICTGTTTQLQVNATPGAGTLTYNWTPPAGLTCANCSNPIASPASLTTYTVVVTNTAGCTDTDTVRVDVQAKPDVIASNDKTICSGDTVQLNVTGALFYDWTPGTALTDSTIANPIATPTATTSYVVIGSYGSGACRDTDTVVITVNPTPVLTVSNDTTICSGRSTRLQATNSGGGATVYSWTPTTGLSNPSSFNPLATPTATTTYTVIATNTPGGCADTDSVVVTVIPSPIINAGPDQGLCPGQTYTFPSVGVADSYSWTPTTDLSCTTCDAPTVSRAATSGPVTYTVVGINLNGCTDTDQVVINTYPGVTLTKSNDTTICSGASITLSASGATTYRWSPNLWITNPTSATPIVTPLATTTYYVVGLDATGCSDTDSVVVTVLPSPNLVVGNNFNLCSGTTAQLTASNTNTGSTGPISYNWSPATGLSNPSIANPTVSNLSTPVIYTIVATDAGNGCTDTAYEIITPVQSPTVTAAVSIPSVCYGQATNLSATGAATYQWSPNVGLTCTACANPNALPNATTTYTVVGSANNGCADTASVTVTVNPLPVVSVTPDSSTICAGQSVQLNAAGGAPFYTWAPSTGLSCTSCPDPIATPAITTIYRVTARTSFGCTATAQSVVVVNPKANVVAAAQDTVICEGDSTILLGSGALNYTWYPATGLSCTNCTNPVAHPIISTTYRVIGSGVALCDDTAYVYVRVIPKPDLTVTPSAASVCYGQGITLTASSSATGIYNWQPTNGLSSTNSPSTIASPLRTTVYTASFTALATGCTARQDVEVQVKALPNVDAGPDRMICAGVPTVLKVFGASTYVWSPATGLSCTVCNNPTATIYDSTTYVITGTDAFGCVNTDTLTLTIVPRDTLTLTPDTTICAGSSIRLRATGGTSYLWSPVTNISNPRIANPTVFPAETTTYRVAIANADCYVDTLSVKVTVAPIPVVNAGVDANIVPGASVTLAGSVPAEVVRYYWTPVDFLSCNDCLTPVATPRITTTYTLHGLTVYGCEGRDSVTIFTRCNSSQIFMPNTFTPNGDGQNDRFYPRGNGLGNIKSFRIYSRWGELVYEAQNISLNDENTGWDGIFKGQPLKPDTYVWILEGTCETGDPLTMKGDVSIIR